MKKHQCYVQFFSSPSFFGGATFILGQPSHCPIVIHYAMQSMDEFLIAEEEILMEASRIVTRSGAALGANM